LIVNLQVKQTGHSSLEAGVVIDTHFVQLVNVSGVGELVVSDKFVSGQLLSNVSPI
jgi:hypothetical protein